jgi:predicted permease
LLSQLTGIVAPVFLLAGLGFAWHRLGFAFERDFVTRIVMNVSAPCLIVDTLGSLQLPLHDFLIMLGAAGVFFVINALLAAGVLRAIGLPSRSFLPALTFGNNGNLGLPLALFAFGEAGLGLAMAVFVFSAVSQFSIAPMFQSQAPALRTLVTTPVTYGSLVGLTLLASGAALPVGLARGISMLGSVAIPLMLLALGYSLGGFRLARIGRAALLGSLRILVGLGSAFIAAQLLGLEGLPRQVLLLQGAMPAAVFNYLLAARYQRDPQDVAGVVLVSTCIALVTTPVLLAWLLGGP